MIGQYLRRSFQRRFLRHFSLFWIMLCAFLLPLVVSTYRDSMEYGARQQLNSISKGCALHILEAAPEDLELFRNIDGLTEPFYENGTIYLSYESEEFWKKSTDLEILNSMSDEEWNDYFAEDQRIRAALDSAMDKSSSNLDIVGYAYDMWGDAIDNPDMEVFMQKILYLNIALLLFSGVIVYSAYGNHIAGFSQEMADLCALGATKGQIVRLFLAEFVIIFPLSALGAVGLSGIVMRYLYEHFLGNTADSVAMWEIFYMNPRTTALEILFYFLVCLCTLAFSLMRRPRSRKWKQPRTQSSSLPVLWTRRTKPPIIHCLLILVPLVTAFVLLFNRYLNVNIQNTNSIVEGLIVVTSGEGRLLLLSWIFCILMSVAMQIIWVRLAAYVRNYAPMLKILFQVGGSRRQLFKLIPVWLGAASAVILPYLIAIPWIKMQANRHLIVSGPVLCIYAVIAVFTIIIFWLPVKYTLHKILENTK